MSVDVQTSSFLNAIDKYGQSQREEINKELEDYKENEFSTAIREGQRNKDSLISKNLQSSKSRIITEYAFKEQELRKSIFLRRQEIVNEIKTEVKNKLISFHSSQDYISYLKNSLNEIVKLFDDNTVTIYLSAQDNDKKDIFNKILANVEFIEDKKITIGGFKAYSKELKILVDETFDTKLDDEINKFIASSKLKVV